MNQNDFGTKNLTDKVPNVGSFWRFRDDGAWRRDISLAKKASRVS